MFKNWSDSQYMGYLANDGRGVFMLKEDYSGFKTNTDDQKDTSTSSSSQARSTLTWESETSDGKSSGTKNKKPSRTDSNCS